MHIEGLRNSFVTENWRQLELWKITHRHYWIHTVMPAHNDQIT